MEDETLNIKKILWDIILSWRSIFVFAIIFGLVLGGYKYKKEVDAYKLVSAMDASEATDNVDDLIASLNDDNRAQVSILINMYKQIKDTQDFIDNNVLMKIDPYNKKELHINYYVKLKNLSDIGASSSITDKNTSMEVYGGNLSAIYARYASSNEGIDIIKNNSSIELDDKDISSLISVDCGNYNGVFTVNIVCLEGMDSDAIADEINKLLMSKIKDTQVVAENELIKTDASVTIKADTELITTRNTYFSQLATLKNGIITSESKLTDEQKKYVESAKKIIFAEENKSDETTEKVVVQKPGIPVKFVAIGIILGIMLVCCWVFIKNILTAKLEISEDITAKHNITLFGMISSETDKKRIFGFIDRKLIEIRDRHKKHLTYEQMIESVTTGIAICCQKKKIGKVILSGTEIENISQKYIGDIEKSLISKNINVVIVNDIYYDPNALQNSVDVNNIVFVEKIGLSIKDEISNEINKAKEYNIDILGCVIIE